MNFDENKGLLSAGLGLVGLITVWVPILGIVVSSAGLFLGYTSYRDNDDMYGVAGMVMNVFIFLFSFITTAGFLTYIIIV